MAIVVPGYVPADGALFDPTGWNGDIRSTTNGVSVFGELNGHIQNANIAAGELVHARHIRPLENFRAEWGGQTDTTDWYELLWGTDYDVTNGWLAVPGASRRIYCPWDATAAVLQVSAFGSNLRMREVSAPPAGPDPVPPSGPNMYIAMFIDDVRERSTTRRFPYSYYPSINPGTPEYFNTREPVMTHHFDLVKVNLLMTKGYHDVALKIQIPQNTGKESMYALYAGGAADQLCDHSVTHRIRLGIRAASIIAFP